MDKRRIGRRDADEPERFATNRMLAPDTRTGRGRGASRGKGVGDF